MKIAIVGQGYVGLPLALQFARSGVTVVGLDVDPAKVAALNRGQSYIKHISNAAIAEQVHAGRFSASCQFDRIREVEAVIICVPTPLNKNREPDISYILRTGEAVAPHLKAGTGKSRTGRRMASSRALGSGSPALRTKLVVLESTTYPGTTDEDLRAVLENGSGLKAGVGFHLAFSPEREDPGNPQSRVAVIPKVVGGLTPACLKRATEPLTARRLRPSFPSLPAGWRRQPSCSKTRFAASTLPWLMS